MSTPDAPEILFVKKLLAGGEPCSKCRDIERRLHRDGLMRYVGASVEAREDDPSSAGMRIAERHGVRRAPFFVVRHADGEERIIESYLALKQWLSGNIPDAGGPSSEDLADTVDRHPELAFI